MTLRSQQLRSEVKIEQHEVQLQKSMPFPNFGMNLIIIQKTVYAYVRNCVIYKSIDKGLGLYTPIHTSYHAFKNVVRDFNGGLPISLFF